MERFFLGGNTAYGFRGFYDGELARADNVVLLKGAPGTGKSTLIKGIGAECARRGLDHEMWYCSGDPSSADGIYVKELSAAVADATSPHPCEPSLPVIRERTADMAAALDRTRLLPRKAEIERLLKFKKDSYERAYDMLKSAFSHYRRAERMYLQCADAAKIRRLAAAFALSERALFPEDGGRGRDVFSSAITADGNVSFYDHLAGKRVFVPEGCEIGARIFAEEVAALAGGGIRLHFPLLPEHLDGVLFPGVAVVSDAGQFGTAAEKLYLGDGEGAAACEAELNRCREWVKAACAELAAARTAHLKVEKLHAECMDYSVTDEIAERVKKMLFG